ncbi:UBP1-associated protein 2A-like [Aristolochia californica]|uniref:UBP1-associated protein 2A-like n=1 Tax=Aristolochia californica TaxID=171875 RepID=UPI0035DE1D61
MAQKRKLDESLDPVPDSSSDSDTEEEDIGKVLEPFNKEQLIDLLRTAASNDPSLVSEIHRVADLDPAHRKLFVHGLGWDTTSDKLRTFFTKYGELEDCNVVVDKNSGKSKGYGFVLFKHRRSAQKALKNPQKKVENRMTACQLASMGPAATGPNSLPQVAQNSQDTLARKIYVGNVNSEISAVKLHSFFSKYGEIEEGPLGFDKQTGKSKGFALFIYKTAEGARKALEEPNKNFEGHQLYCQKATDSHKTRAAATGTTGPAAIQPATGFSNGPDMGASASAALLSQGLFAGAIPFNQAVPPNHAALAVLAAAGQNPAAFGMSPAMIAAMNPAFAAAMNPGAITHGGQPVGPAVAPGLQGYGMGNTGYQNAGYQAAGYQSGHNHQAGNSYPANTMSQATTGPRPHSGVGPMGGYVNR